MKNHLNTNFYTTPAIARQVMTTKEARETIQATENFIMACGRGWSLKVKNIGAGMKEVSLQPFK